MRSKQLMLGDAGKELTGRKAAELIDMYCKEKGVDGADNEIPLPQCFIDTIGQTYKFRIKLSHYNFTSKSKDLTVTKIVSPTYLPSKDLPLEKPLLTLCPSEANKTVSDVGSSGDNNSVVVGSSTANIHSITGNEEQRGAKRRRSNA